ncbi:MAG: ECF transporter S component [Tenericutes bacterium HGW-Tenericutes-6]|jgi:riboflavin transporter FmnP|nr:MAG: ECF transporter S component [Tenericutes bacterium HGW-Tenericutes-6]
MTLREHHKLALASLLLALGIVLPFLTGQIPEIGSRLLPMHLPVLLCGFICGWKYGLGVGFITPILRSLLFTMPPLYPVAIAMSFELATYGLLTGLLYHLLPKKPYTVFVALIISMLGGRIIYGILNLILLSLNNRGYTFQIYISSVYIDAIPGLILQLTLIPLIIRSIEAYQGGYNGIQRHS